MRLLIVFICAASFMAFACPDLSGVYYCPDENLEFNVLVQITQQTDSEARVRYQRTQNNKTEFLIADGVNHSVETGVFKGKIKYWCDKSVLKTSQAGDLYEEGEIVGKLSSSMGYALDAEKNLVSQGEAHIQHLGETYLIPMDYKCLRKN